jgi:exopolysaccharide biosynthesis protein
LRSPRHSAARLESRRLRSRRYRSWSIRNARLRELATLIRGLGARDAIKLDGGGSTTFVYADPNSGGALRIANRPSDKEGERAVGDALAIVHRSCVSGGRVP